MEEIAIEKLQKENAALKRQLERQRSDLMLIVNNLKHGWDIAYSEIHQIKWYLKYGDFTCPEVKEMLLANQPAHDLSNDSTDNGAVPLK